MATGRVLIVHESGATRALLTELLAREGLGVEAVSSSYECITRFVDEPAELVILGLGGMADTELELVSTLKQEARPPRILVSFPSPLRDMAVRALRLGADAYVLEPFYGDEVMGLVRGQLELGAPPPPSAALQHLASEVVHAIGNPLQVLTLLLSKDRVTKKELMDTVPPNVRRMEQVVALLRDFGAAPAASLETADPRPLVERAAAATGVALRADAVPHARLDPHTYAVAIEGLFAGLAARTGAKEPPKARLTSDDTHVIVRATVPRDAFRGEKAGEVLEQLIVVQPDREVIAGLAGPRALLEAQGGSLRLEQSGRQAIFVAQVARA